MTKLNQLKLKLETLIKQIPKHLITPVFSIVFLLCFAIYTNPFQLLTFKGRLQIISHYNSDFFSSLYGDSPVVFKETGDTMGYTYGDLGIKVKWSEEQKKKLDRFCVNLDKMEIAFECSDKLATTLESFNDDRQSWASATFVETETDFVVTEEVIGNKLDVVSIEELMMANCSINGLAVDLDSFKYAQPKDWITADEYKAEVKQWSEFLISYSNGFEITKANIKPYFYLSEDYEIVFNETKREQLKEQVWSWIENDLNGYNTLGGTFKFKTHSGDIVELRGVNYGDKVNKQAEFEFLMNAIENLQGDTLREPEATVDFPNDIQSNVIEVSIQDQRLWLWRDGEVVIETDIVTGRAGIYDTPKGVYQILNMIDGVFLEGADYKAWVDKWMRFWNGYGLHDATWRGQFGEEIYKYNGSHGCINLPYDFAVQLYDKVKPGDCVVIY